jgi:hypothetical protein
MRYHPAVVAQKAATVELLAGGRFLPGFGAGETLNEHVVGRAWRSSRSGGDSQDRWLDWAGETLSSASSPQPATRRGVAILGVRCLVHRLWIAGCG